LLISPNVAGDTNQPDPFDTRRRKECQVQIVYFCPWRACIVRIWNRWQNSQN